MLRIISSINSVAFLDRMFYCVCCCSVARSCLTLCDCINCSLPGSSAHGVLLAKILEWVAISFSRGSSWTRDRTRVSWIGRCVPYHWAVREARSTIYLAILFQTNAIHPVYFDTELLLLILSVNNMKSSDNRQDVYSFLK